MYFQLYFKCASNVLKVYFQKYAFFMLLFRKGMYQAAKTLFSVKIYQATLPYSVSDIPGSIRLIRVSRNTRQHCLIRVSRNTRQHCLIRVSRYTRQHTPYSGVKKYQATLPYSGVKKYQATLPYSGVKTYQETLALFGVKMYKASFALFGVKIHQAFALFSYQVLPSIHLFTGIMIYHSYSQ